VAIAPHRSESPVELSLEPIVKLKQQGKIRHIGLSEVKPKDIDRAR
jgi:aryl-alcohol dehydrogenase-like predicted oxidoreductase